MNPKFLKQLIEKCPLTDFSANGNVDERSLQLDKYLESFTEDLYSNEPLIIKKLWQESFAKNQLLIIQQSSFLRRCLVFLDVSVAIFNHISSKYIKNKSTTKTAKMLSVQFQNIFNLFKTILILFMNGCFHSVLAEYRTMYESFVITKYLLLHPELISIYKEHADFLVLHINKMSNNNTPEQEKRYDEFIKKYGNDFSENFGWTKNIITNKKDRKLITLVNECNYVHPSSFSSISRIKPNFINPFLQACLYIIDDEMLDYLKESKIPNREGVILRNLLDFIFEDINKGFFNIEK